MILRKLRRRSVSHSTLTQYGTKWTENGENTRTAERNTRDNVTRESMYTKYIIFLARRGEAGGMRTAEK
jgi:hypothetical protein